MIPQSNGRSMLHIGCGYAMEWKTASREDAVFPEDMARIVLVDANHACIEDLRPLARKDARIRLIEAAVAQTAGQAPFHILTLEDFSCLCPPDRLTALMPGLALERQIDVRCMTIGDVLAKVDIDGNANLLVLEALSEETTILRDLVASGAADRFSGIAVQVARIPLQDGNLDPAGVTLLLAEQGFALDTPAADADPDFPRLHFRRDPVLFAAVTARRAAEGALVDAEAGSQHLQARLARLERDRDTDRAQAAQQLAAVQAAHDATQAELHDARNALGASAAKATVQGARIAALEAALQTGETALAASAEELRKSQDSREILKGESARRLARIEALEAEKVASVAAAAAQTATLAAVKAEATKTAAQLKETQTSLAASSDEARKWQESRELVKDESARRLVRIEALEAEKVASVAAAAAQTALLTTAKAELAQTVTQLKVAQAALATSAEELRKVQESHDLVTEESARRFARIEELECGQAASKAEAEAVRSQLDGAVQNLHALQSQLANAEAAQCKVTADLSLEREALAKEKATVTRAEGQAKTASTELETLKTALRGAETRQASAQSDLSLALRMQQLTGADLKDLQDRYADLLAQKDRQDRLIAQLAVRLEEAAVHLQKPRHPAPLADLLPTPAKQISKKAAKAKKLHKTGKAGRAGDAEA